MNRQSGRGCLWVAGKGLTRQTTCQGTLKMKSVLDLEGVLTGLYELTYLLIIVHL